MTSPTFATITYHMLIVEYDYQMIKVYWLAAGVLFNTKQRRIGQLSNWYSVEFATFYIQWEEKACCRDQ
jgi:hypothetical protein